MANWHIQSTSGETITGFTISNTPSHFESNNVVLTAFIAANVDAGEVVNISASNFVIGGSASETVTGTGNDAVYQFTGGNVDLEVQSVSFSNEGIAGQPNNRVKVEVTLSQFPTPSLNSNSTIWPNISGNYQIYIDIDERAEDPPSPNVNRLACIKTKYDYSADQNVVVTNLSGISNEVLVTGDANNDHQNGHSGTVTDNDTTLIAEITHTVSNTSTHYYADTPYVELLNLNSLGFDYTDAYTYEIDFTYTDSLSTGVPQITSFVTKIFYTPPLTPDLNPDPVVSTGKFCNLSHLAFIHYTVQSQTTVVTDTIHDVVYPPTAPYRGGSHRVVVKGTSGSKYKIFVEKKSSTTSNQAASNKGYYNFNYYPVTENVERAATAATSKSFSYFQDSPCTHIATIGSDGTNDHYISLPRVDIDTNYDIRLEPVGTTSFTSDVPQTNGEAVINQYGFNIVTVKPNSFFLTYDTFPEVKRYYAKEYKEDIYNHPIKKAILTSGGNGNSSSTRVILNPLRGNQRIEVGMIVTTKNTSGSSIIAHNTKVAKIKNNVVILSAAAAIPDNTFLRFHKENQSIIPFNFTVQAAGSETIALVSPAGDTTNVLSGNLNEFTKTTPKITGGNTLTFNGSGFEGSIEGIAVGMIVKGDGVIGLTDPVDGATYTTVQSINVAAGSVVVAHSQIILSLGTVLTFSMVNSEVIEDANLIDLQVSVPSPQTSPDSAIIQGYLSLEEVNNSAELLINLDGLLTIS
jgi:hypothetical protein|tara:strand:- start:6196 stop:8427 length:2232 start_codon:yes stop_codon:yes gene_type:complete